MEKLLDEAKVKRLIRGETRGLAAGVARLVLRMASVPYAFVMGCRNRAYDAGWLRAHRAPVPVISVGNLTVGGTGKTPIVEYLAKQLRRRHQRVAILSRGYGNKDGPNDEALLLEQNLPDVPHLQGRDRVELAQIAVQELESEVLLLDDGFQHRRLCRNLDLLLLDATDPWGGGRQLPAGLLREGLSSLRRANFAIVTRVDLVDDARVASIVQSVRRLAGELPVAKARFLPRSLARVGHDDLPVDWLVGRRVLAFCGIGNPSGFWSSIERLGANILDRRTFPDHFGYRREDIDELSRWGAASGADGIVTTQKDAVKIPIPSLGGCPLFSLRIEAEIIEGEEVLLAGLDRVLAAGESSSSGLETP